MSCLQIGRILEIKRPIKKSQGAESIKVNVAWFYRPEESLGGRKVSVSFAFGAYCCMAPTQPKECIGASFSQSLGSMPGVSTLVHEPVCQAPASETSASPCHASRGSVPGEQCSCCSVCRPATPGACCRRLCDAISPACSSSMGRRSCSGRPTRTRLWLAQLRGIVVC